MATEIAQVPYSAGWNYSSSLPSPEQLTKSLETLAKKDKGFKNPLGLPDNELIGMEVEVERTSPAVKVMYWTNKEDNSLRNNGREFVTEIVPAVWAPFLLRSLFQHLNPEAEMSERCSIHIHLNMRDMTDDQLLSWLTVYYVFEQLLFNFVGDDRSNSIFCVPLSQSHNFSMISGFMRQQSSQHHAPTIMMNCVTEKYAALNTAPMISFGSWEFRHMGGTKDHEKVSTWVALLLRIKVYAKKHSWKEIQDKVASLNTTSQYGGFLHEVFDILSNVIASTNLQKDMEQGVADAKLHSADNAYFQASLGPCAYTNRRDSLMKVRNKSHDKKAAYAGYPWEQVLHLHPPITVPGGFLFEAVAPEEDGDLESDDNPEDGEEF